MKKTFLFFFILFSCILQLQAQNFAFLPKLKKFVAKQSLPPGYYNSDWLVRTYEYNYDTEGKLISCLQLSNKDTLEFTRKEYDAGSRVMKSKSIRALNGDSTITFEYNESGDLIHSHTIALKMSPEFFIEKTQEFKNVFIEQHEIFSAEYDKNHKQLKNQTRYFSLYENDSVQKSYVLPGYTGSSESDKQIPPVQYNRKTNDSLPAVVYADGYNSIWQPGATFEYDKEIRLIKMYYNLDGFGRYFLYEWKGDLLIHKKQMSGWEATDAEDEWEYEYVFY